jgi:hypothetical protein
MRFEAGSMGERPEIPVSCKEWNREIDTALGDQGVAKARLATLCQYFCSQRASPLPIAGTDFDEKLR